MRLCFNHRCLHHEDTEQKWLNHGNTVITELKNFKHCGHSKSALAY